MATEIERKYLVTAHGWKTPGAGVLYRQGYLSVDKERTVRVRIAGANGYLTIKGASSGIARAEYEYDIPLADARQMLDSLCLQPQIEKLRYCIEYKNHRWEVDEFLGDNRGLVVAEVELAEVAEQIDLPDWIGSEVSDDPRYFNSSLVTHPYNKW